MQGQQRRRSSVLAKGLRVVQSCGVAWLPRSRRAQVGGSTFSGVVITNDSESFCRLASNGTSRAAALRMETEAAGCTSLRRGADMLELDGEGKKGGDEAGCRSLFRMQGRITRAGANCVSGDSCK